MKKISIIIPIFNEPRLIFSCIDSLVLACQECEYEIIIVDDGSNQETKDNLEKLKNKNIKVFYLEKNFGRAYARLFGARNAMYEKIILFDSRVEADKNFISNIVCDYDIVMTGDVKPKKNNLFHKSLNTLREFVFRSYYKNLNSKQDYYELTEENFNSTPKGTTAVYFRDKEILFKICQDLDVTDKNISEDTRIFKKGILMGFKIFRALNARVFYFQREGIVNNLVHLYQRGPRFVDYYLRFPNKFRKFLYLYIVLSIILILLLFINPLLLLCLIILFIFLSLIFVFYISKKFDQFIALIVTLPFIILAFSLGVTKGIIIYFLKHNKSI